MTELIVIPHLEKDHPISPEVLEMTFPPAPRASIPMRNWIRCGRRWRNESIT